MKNLIKALSHTSVRIGMTTLVFVLGYSIVFSQLTKINSYIVRPYTSDFDDGWKDGYCEGWKEIKGELAICPIAPIAPIPPVGCDTYKCGFRKGVKAGMKAAKNNDSSIYR